MAIVLGLNQYGKAQNRLLRVVRDTPRHEIRDLNVSIALRGDFADAHVTGDQAKVLPTDTQKNTVYAFAKKHGVGEVEDFARILAAHFVDDVASVRGARVEIEEYAWDRIESGGRPHDHAFVRAGDDTRTTVVTVEEDGGTRVVSGIKDLAVLKSTGSEFRGFAQDEYTTLPETDDRVLATTLQARWRYLRTEADWAGTYTRVRRLLLEQFADEHSYALQGTLYAMGRSVLAASPEVAEIRFAAPNKHHFRYDLSPFGLDNPGEIFHADDRPYGLIEATVARDDAPDEGVTRWPPGWPEAGGQ